ncbi:YcaO-like family protein [Chelativorans xinjiangense]|uniref:YcaO-like family protein n=1 Tax=Chelativorans xinjiangense TaxID=2681485 RepID=UPI0013595791|nr:YcaO-like family protein [Chelativorans xinjiangense]
MSPTHDDLDCLLSRLLPLCRKARITRLGDLTGLDRIGLPVVQAIRPGALSEVTALGRGLSVAEAAVGAVMESLERFFSEIIPPDRIFLASAGELGIPQGLFENLARPSYRGEWREVQIPWILALDVSSGSTQPVPLELVHTCYTESPPAGDGVFLRTTTGLACHVSAPAAFLHCLFECIERDAMARAFAMHGFFDRMRLRSSTPFSGKAQRLLDLARENGLSVAFWYVPSPTEVPVVWCQTIETGPGEPTLALPTEGHAAGPTLEAAAFGALLEALVTRAAAISGTRDDQTRRHYRSGNDALVAQARQLIAADVAPIDPATIENLAAVDLGSFVQQVAVWGLGPVLAVPVGSDSESGVHCIRTILPAAQPFAAVR